MTPTDNPFPSHFEYPGRLAYTPSALNFFRFLFFHQKQTGANKVTPTDNPIPSHFEYPERLAGAPSALIFFRLLFFHQGKKRRSEDRRVTQPIRETYKGAYSIRPYPAGRKKNLCPSVSLIPINFKKTYTSHRPILIKKINQCPLGLPLPISFKKTYTSHQPIPIKKINQCPSGLPLLIHFSNIAHHTLCFSFK